MEDAVIFAASIDQVSLPGVQMLGAAHQFENDFEAFYGVLMMLETKMVLLFTPPVCEALATHQEHHWLDYLFLIA